VQASPEELNRWLGREVSEPVQIATEPADLTSELKRGLSFVRKHTPARRKTRVKSPASLFRVVNAPTTWREVPVQTRTDQGQWRTVTLRR
jgi:hypothetical protein